MSKILLSLICLFSFNILFAQENVSNKNTSALDLTWKSRGPSNVSGITRALLWDKNDENIIYAGGLAGGLFKTVDKGENWFSVASFGEANPSISSMTQSSNGTIFVGTGFSGGDIPDGTLYNYSFSGNGIYKSADQGFSWTSISVSNEYYPTNQGEWSVVNAMAAHPMQSNILLVGNNNGIRVSSNANAPQPTFTEATGISSKVSAIAFVQDGTEAWVAAGGSLYHATDLANNFTTFSLKNPPVNSSNRAQLALSAIDAQGNYTIYASFTSASGCLIGIYKSEDRGTNWTPIASAGGIDPFAYPSGGCQGWYSHSIAVNPNNKDIIYIGGVNFNTITTQGNLIKIDDNISENSSNFLPTDKHAIAFNPFNANEMLIGTDQGVFLSSNALSGHPYNITYTSKNNNLNNSNTLNAGFGKDGNIIISGIQNTHYVDYSSISGPYFASKIWNKSNITAEISNYEESVFLYSGYYGSLRKSINYGNTNFPFLDSNIDPAACNHITCAALNAGFDCENSIHSGSNFLNEQYLYESETKAKYFVPTRCGNKLYVCTNPLSLTAEPIYSSFNIRHQSGTKAMDVSADGDRFVFGSGTKVGVIDGFDSFTASIPDDINTNTAQIDTFYADIENIGILSISGISIDKNNKDHIIVVEDAYGSTSKVAKTLDGGQTWSLIHNNLAEIPVFDCIIDANNSNNYILATLQGIYTSNDAGLTWQKDQNGMGEIPIFRIKQEWVLEENCYVLLAATVGKGVYTSTTLTSCNKDVEAEIWGVFNPIKNVLENDLAIKIYPNPSQGNFKIEIKTETRESLTVKIFDVFGKQVLETKIKESLEVKTTNWAKGMYFISIENSFAKVLVK